MSGTATPSEVFHRNLVDAVSNVEGLTLFLKKDKFFFFFSLTLIS